MGKKSVVGQNTTCLGPDLWGIERACVCLIDAGSGGKVTCKVGDVGSGHILCSHVYDAK